MRMCVVVYDIYIYIYNQTFGHMVIQGFATFKLNTTPKKAYYIIWGLDQSLNSLN